jgi:pSer/pThr/pTyr-binding forkhead associated (FHA) protein
VTSGPLAQAPRVSLLALTPESTIALGCPELGLTTFPYRVGRESRSARWAGGAPERRQLRTTPSNELYIREVTEPFNVSREHFHIEWDGQRLILVDRGSTCGTIVEGDRVGGQGRVGSVALRDADVIIIGTSFSPFVFKVRMMPA